MWSGISQKLRLIFSHFACNESHVLLNMHTCLFAYTGDGFWHFSAISFFLVTIILPLPTHKAVLGILMFAHGVCLGAQNNGEACYKSA